MYGEEADDHDANKHELSKDSGSKEHIVFIEDDRNASRGEVDQLLHLLSLLALPNSIEEDAVKSYE